MKEISDYIKMLTMQKNWSTPVGRCFKDTVVAAILCLAATAMLIMNIINDSEMMAQCSVALVIGFLASIVCAAVFRMPAAAEIVIGVLIALILSIFALTGGNEGFAILWILLVPMFGISLLGVGGGLILATYFLIFIVIFFLTPAKSLIVDKYTMNFVSRFPVLYMADYLVAGFLSIQKEYYFRKVHLHSYTDELTGAYNRRYYMELLGRCDLEKENYFVIMAFDVNGLKKVNDLYGHEAGDELIAAVPGCFKKVFGEEAVIARMGGDEFAAIIRESDSSVSYKVTQLKKEAAKWKGTNGNNLAFSIGWASKHRMPGADIKQLSKTADMLMYKDKSEYYKIKQDIP